MNYCNDLLHGLDFASVSAKCMFHARYPFRGCTQRDRHPSHGSHPRSMQNGSSAHGACSLCPFAAANRIMRVFRADTARCRHCAYPGKPPAPSNGGLLPQRMTCLAHLTSLQESLHCPWTFSDDQSDPSILRLVVAIYSKFTSRQTII